VRVRSLVLLIVVAACSGSEVSRELGARCDDSTECDDRCLLPGPAYPDGFCTRSCDDHTDCPRDAACVGDDGGVCLLVCRAAIDCEFLGVGWSCATRSGRPDGEVMVCRGL
jgi:hypothetical protein